MLDYFLGILKGENLTLPILISINLISNLLFKLFSKSNKLLHIYYRVSKNSLNFVIQNNSKTYEDEDSFLQEIPLVSFEENVNFNMLNANGNLIDFQNEKNIFIKYIAKKSSVVFRIFPESSFNCKSRQKKINKTPKIVKIESHETNWVKYMMNIFFRKFILFLSLVVFPLGIVILTGFIFDNNPNNHMIIIQIMRIISCLLITFAELYKYYILKPPPKRIWQIKEFFMDE